MVKQQHTKIGTYTVSYANGEEFHQLKNEIFATHSYFPEIELDDCTAIVDVGAHIGLSTLYFAKQFPLATITAVEPHPASFELLSENIWSNRLEDRVIGIEAAVTAGDESEVELWSESDHWLSSSCLQQGAWTGEQITTSLTVPALRLRDLVSDQVDLLKIDIEGAEHEVLSRDGECLQLVRYCILEFHPTSKEASLPQTIDLLHSHGLTHVRCFQKSKPVEPSRARGLVTVHAWR